MMRSAKSKRGMTKYFAVLIAQTLTLTAAAAIEVPGGFSPVPVTDAEVIAAAEFAVQAQQDTMRKESNDPVKLQLVKIIDAQRQIVSGINYLLHLELKTNDEEKEAEAVVWWQGWRKPDPFQLTSWKWVMRQENKPNAEHGK